MPAIGFICPDGQKIRFEECFKRCRFTQEQKEPFYLQSGRCMSLPTLKRMARQRPWKGKPSTTQLINGTRLELLKITTEYYIDPQKRAFALLGTKHHEDLEDADFLVEEKFEDNDMTGIMDHLDDIEEILYDYKTSGSFKVARALGIVNRKERDPSGALYKKAGSYKYFDFTSNQTLTKKFKKGDPKMITVFERNPARADMQDWILQLNRYRIFVEETGFTVKKMKVQVTVRDGGIKAATQRGVDRNIQLISIPRMQDKDVQDYFSNKTAALHEALRMGYAPKCNSEETWQGKRCTGGYCEVAEACEVMGNNA